MTNCISEFVASHIHFQLSLGKIIIFNEMDEFLLKTSILFFIFFIYMDNIKRRDERERETQTGEEK